MCHDKSRYEVRNEQNGNKFRDIACHRPMYKSGEISLLTTQYSESFYVGKSSQRRRRAKAKLFLS
jgi:hypothetical protein